MADILIHRNKQRKLGRVRRQRIAFKRKNKTKLQEKNKTEISNLPGKGSRVGTSLVVERLGLHAPNVGGQVSVPGQVTKSHKL